MMPMEPLWDILLPLISLAVGTSLGALGMQITLGMTFVQPLLLLLLPSFLTILESFHERLLAWHLGGIFGQPMLVAQVAIAHAERHEGAGCLKAFGVLVGIYTLGAVLGGLIRSLLQMLPWPYAHQACAQLLILFLVVGNLMTIWHNGHMLGHHEEHTPLLSERKNLKVFKERCSKYLVSEVQRNGAACFFGFPIQTCTDTVPGSGALGNADQAYGNECRQWLTSSAFSSCLSSCFPVPKARCATCEARGERFQYISRDGKDCGCQGL